MKIAIGCDHGGYNLKQDIIAYLEKQDIEYIDCGTFSTESCNYPDYAKVTAESVLDGSCELGILVCGTGIGMSMAANKIKGIRAAVCSDVFSAKYTRLHNNANILCLGERVLGTGLALELVDVFINTAFEGGRHQTRIDMLENI